MCCASEVCAFCLFSAALQWVTAGTTVPSRHLPTFLGVGTVKGMLVVRYMPMLLGVGNLNRMLVVRHMPMCLGVGTVNRMLVVHADVLWCWHYRGSLPTPRAGARPDAVRNEESLW